MSQDEVSSRSTDATCKRRSPPRAVAGGFGEVLRPCDDSMFSALAVSRSVARRVPSFARRPLLRAARSAAVAAMAADRRPRPRHPSDDAFWPGAASRGNSWAGWASRRNIADKDWGRTCFARPRTRCARTGPCWACFGPRFPASFSRRGWAACGQPSYRRANACAIRGRLLDSGLIPRPRRRLHIRPWLQWEQAALARIYASRDAYGPLERTPAYWQWLLHRHGYDQVYVALEGPELSGTGRGQHPRRRLRGDSRRTDRRADDRSRTGRARRPSCWPAAAAMPLRTTVIACCCTRRRRTRCSESSTKRAARVRRKRPTTARSA